MSKIDVFSKFQPLSLNLSKDDEKDTIDIEGIATSEHIDSSGEIILQDGIDWSYCLKNGSFNYDHSNLPGHIVGAPQSIQRVMHNGKAATAIKGILYAKKQIVKDLVENYKAMKSAGGIRQIGFSIEGQVLSRDNKNPNVITRAKVLNVSLTHQPCNTEATVALVKSILNNIEKEDEMPEEIIKNEYSDLHMTLGEARLSCEYAEKLVAFLEALPQDADLPEWVQKKVSMSKEYLQTAFHYLDQEQGEGELDKDVSPEYLDGLEEEAVVAPEKIDVELPIEKGYGKDEDIDKMDRQQLADYVRFLQGLVKESDLSPIQPQSLEDDELASEEPMMNIGKEEDEEEPEVELEIEGLTPEQIKQLIMGMLNMNLSIQQMQDYIKQYTK